MALAWQCLFFSALICFAFIIKYFVMRKKSIHKWHRPLSLIRHRFWQQKMAKDCEKSSKKKAMWWFRRTAHKHPYNRTKQTQSYWAERNATQTETIQQQTKQHPNDKTTHIKFRDVQIISSGIESVGKRQSVRQRQTERKRKEK